jgi:hypothetical protein
MGHTSFIIMDAVLLVKGTLSDAVWFVLSSLFIIITYRWRKSKAPVLPATHSGRFRRTRAEESNQPILKS